MKREEAIRRIKAWNLDSDDREVLAVVIPELAESEDERTRKEIVEFIRSQIEDGNSVGWDRWIAYLEKQKEQKPEWSEEDETYLQDTLWCIEQAEKVAKDEGDMGACWSARRWLKSLRPSWKPSEVCYGPTGDPDPAGVWKPSEEQMKALHRCIYYLHGEGSGYFEPIKSLYEQLKKL